MVRRKQKSFIFVIILFCCIICQLQGYWEKQLIDWKFEIVPGIVGICPSIAIDSNNNPRISYFDAGNNTLKYAEWTGISWSTKTVDTVGKYGYYSSIAIDSNNNPHISYYDYANQALKYAKWTGNSWNIQTVDTNKNVEYYGFDGSLKLDNDDKPHIAYSGYDYLKYAKYINDSYWEIESISGFIVDYPPVRGVSLSLGGGDIPYISCLEGNMMMEYSLYYVKKINNSWNIEYVDIVPIGAGYASTTMDKNGVAHISYTSYGLDLKYAK